MLNPIRIVLVSTTHPGNIGAAARAMKNMCLSELVLVNPAEFPSYEALARASGADDVLNAARVCTSLDEALEGCHWVAGTSARPRGVTWPETEPRECARVALTEAARGPVALLFGRERWGLTNDELDRCHHLVRIPSNPDYTSLNLAQAVQILSYELLLASREVGGVETMGAAAAEDAAPSSAEAMEGLFDHLQQTMVDIGFADPTRARKLNSRLRRLLLRARPDQREIGILRGILSAAQGRKSMRREE